MPLQALPRSAESYQRAQQREIAAALVAARRLWRRVGSEFDTGYRLIEPALVGTVQAAQLRVAEGATGFVPDVLEETGQARRLPGPAGTVQTRALVGADGSGRPVESLLEQSVVRAKVAVAEGATVAQALAAGGSWLTTAVGTTLSDTGRAAEVVSMGNHRVGTYVRMLNPPSCSRCAILAGRIYGMAQAFQRHPGCDCRHIPAAESVAGDMTVDTRSYFDSLDPAEQERIFTKAGAEAIREGADISQVVNARRGMRKAQVGGRDVLITSEGTTRRGWAYVRLSLGRGTDVRARGGRYASASRPRVMPETLREIATDREDFIRLLKANGYIL